MAMDLCCQLQNDARCGYATDFQPGPCKLRPWMLSYRRDFSFSSYAEPEDMAVLMELIFNEG